MGTTIEIRNPATGELTGHVPVATSPEIREAASQARDAQHHWKRLPVRERAEVLSRFHDLILDRREHILDTIQSETGKARRDALAELVTVAGTARYYITHGPRHLHGKRRRPAVPLLTSAEIVHKPYGVVGLITPWNYPFLLGIADALPALLAGNAVLIKPSELTPFSAVLARNLLIESGLDPRLAVVIHGAAEAGAELIRHVDYVGFTGGTTTGTKVAVAAAERLIPFSLELGGKNPMIVLQGAPLSEAATGVITGAFANSGQTCIAVERVYVEESIYDEFARRLVEKTASLKLGWSKQWDVDMGSLISKSHADRVLSGIQRAVDEGARALVGSKHRTDLGPAFVEPTILTNVDDRMAISREETFGPVITLHPVRNAEEAIARANDSEFGLNASVWAGGGKRGREIARQIEAGSAVVNSTLLIYNSFDVPMGGFKRSGIGRRHGEYGILRYTQPQSIVSSISAGAGYDSLITRITNQKMANAIVAAVRLWRRIPFLR